MVLQHGGRLILEQQRLWRLQSSLGVMLRSMSTQKVDLKPEAKDSSNASISSSSPSPPPATDYLTMFQGRGITKFGPSTAGRTAKIRVSKYILKDDLVNHLRGCNLQPENLKYVYNALFKQDHVRIECNSPVAFNMLEKQLDKSGRLGFRRLRLEPVANLPWNLVDAYLKGVPRGRTVIMVDIPQNATAEDLERFFEGYNYDPSCATFFTMPREIGGRKQMIKYGVVAFSTQLEALRARRERNGDIFVNKKVTLRFFQ